MTKAVSYGYDKERELNKCGSDGKSRDWNSRLASLGWWKPNRELVLKGILEPYIKKQLVE